LKLEFIRLAEAIREQAQGEKVYLLCNPGNWGDALIRFGTEHFLQAFHIDYEKLLLDGRLSSRLAVYGAGLRGKVLLCSGGGAWCNHYDHLPRTLEVIQRRTRFRKIIVLPSTFEKHYDIPGLQFFRRDRFESAQAMPAAEFCHDLAFFIGSLQTPVPPEKTAFCFRGDVEASGAHQAPAGNHDLSAQGSESDDVAPFFEYLSSYRTIYTDRLHVAIGASLLGREVHLYPGRYFKNHAIFRSSLEPYFPATRWHDNFVPPGV
jgi:exopolysaccharide biosynthesis predicted pyruvyltransferase EpsI